MELLPASDASIQRALRILREGGVIAHATETCYGFACDLSSPAAVQELFAIKQRAATLPVSALFASVENAKQYAEWDARANDLAAKHLPGPLTIILPLRRDCPLLLFPTPAGGETLGIRVSSHPVAQKLASMFGRPLSTTSANIHGAPNPYDAAEIVRQFATMEHQPALILDSGTLPPTPPSTIIDLAGEAGIRREGSLKVR